MVKSDIERRLRVFAKGAEFVTVTQVCGFIGQKNHGRVKAMLNGLSAMDGKYYFVPEVAERLHKRTLPVESEKPTPGTVSAIQ